MDKLLGRAKHGVNRFLRRWNLEIRRIPRSTKTHYQLMGDTMLRLKRLGLEPRTVFDVGVQFGTAGLYNVFEAKHLLVEPVVENRGRLLELCAQIGDAELVTAAASNRTGTAVLSVTDDHHYSRIGKMTGGRWDRDLRREVRLVTLEDLAREKRAPKPYLIKVDVDGTDYEVLEGARGILPDTDCVIVESFPWDMGRKMALLEQNGLFLWDLIDHEYVEGVLFFANMVFLNQRYFAQPQFGPWFERWRHEHHVGQPWHSLYGLSTTWFDGGAEADADDPDAPDALAKQAGGG